MAINKKSYNSIFKANTLFGGLQLYQIFIQVIRSKIIAILLGPSGIGIQGLFTSATKLIQEITSLGLSQSAVKDISEAYASKDIDRISKTTSVLNRLIKYTGLWGLLLVIILSPVLSQTSFGNYDFSIPFIILSSTLLFDQISSGQKAILQGTRRLKDLAKSSALGSTIGLLVTIPLYYILGINGIVPTLVINSIITLLLTWTFVRRLKLKKVQISLSETISSGASMMKMGLAMCFSGILVSLSSYIIRGYVSHIGGTDQVGLYVAGFSIVNSYVGMIFTAISSDFYPRLAAVNSNNEKCREIVNAQGEIGAIIMAPLIIICILFMPIVVNILYSNQFAEANDYLTWAVLGMYFKLASWVIAFQFVAKAESSLFIKNEFAIALIGTSIQLIGYKLAGLMGLGIAFLIKYILYFLQVFIIAKHRYDFYFNKSFVLLYVIQLVLIFCGILVSFISIDIIKYTVGSIVIFLSCFYSWKKLDERISIKDFIHTKFVKKIH